MGESTSRLFGRVPVGVSFRSLLDSPSYTLRNVVAGSALASAGLFVAGYGVARDGGFGPAYRQSVSVYLILFGVFGGLVALFWGAKYHQRVWDRVRDCFAVDDDAYADVVDPVLARAYSLRRVGAEFVVALPVVGAVDLLVGIPFAFSPATASGGCLVRVAGACLSHLVVANYLYGVFVLFVVVAGTHGLVHFLLLVGRVTALPVREVETAAERLEPIVRFSVFAATTLFGEVVLMLLVYDYVVEAAAGAGDVEAFANFVVDFGLVVFVVVGGLLLVGLAVFWIPQIRIHDALVEAKQDRIATLDGEYDRLLATCRDPSESVDHPAAELEIIEAKRRHATEIATWSYNLPFVLHFAGSTVASSVLFLLKVANKLGL